MTTRSGRLRARIAAGFTVRMRIIASVVVLAALGFATAGGAAYIVQSQRIADEIDQSLAGEIAELSGQARAGTDVRTGKPFRSVKQLLKATMQHNVPRESEQVLGLIGGQVEFVQGERGSLPKLNNDASFMAAVRRTLPAGGYGTAQVQGQEVRFATKPVRQGNQTGAYVVATFTADAYGQLSTLMQTFATVGALSLLLVGTVAWAVTGRLLRPLHDLRRTADDIGESDLSRRIPVRGHDNVSQLAATFNAMLDRLERAFATQRQFLDDAGHELRTPLTIVRGHLELLDAGQAEDVESTRSLVLDELDRMGRLVEELVTLAKAERPDFLRRSEVELGSLMDEIWEKAQALGDRGWHRDSHAEATVYLDPQRITQAMMQLVANAVQHTPPDATVALGATVHDARVELWVRDTGPGVPAGAENRVFERFESADSSRSEGSGLGLSIVNAIATAHGGAVRLENRPGVGARFAIMLPAAVRPDTGEADGDGRVTIEEETAEIQLPADVPASREDR